LLDSLLQEIPIDIMGRPAKKSAELTEIVKENGASSPLNNSKKRGRPSISKEEGAKKIKLALEAKKIKLDFRHNRGCGHVLTVGQGDTGQLGLGEDIMEKARPGLIPDIEDAVDVVAGGMHSCYLNNKGEVYTFGCNDEGALGRVVAEEEECFLPGKVDIVGRVVQLSAGDSHTAALTEDGHVFAWGTFRDSSGHIGLIKEGIQPTPVRLLSNVFVKKISSGSDHIVALTMEGEIYTFGNSEQGQLGRVPEMFAHRGGRRGLEYLLTPDKLHVKPKSTVFTDVWAGSYNTIASTTDGRMMVCGLNNYYQMGIGPSKGICFFMPTRSVSLEESKMTALCLGQHHTLIINGKDNVAAIGRADYGRLGLGEDAKDAESPAALPSLKDQKIVEVGCGTAVSYAVTDDGKCYSWGMGTNGQLGTGAEDDVSTPHLMESKQLQNRSVIAVSSGGQHTVLLVKDN